VGVTFEELQRGLGPAVAANIPGSAVPHVCVALPSFSVGESLLSHYADRIPALEHRYLVASLMLHRIESCELVFLSCVAPGDEVLDYYVSLVPAAQQASMRRRLRIVEVPDHSARSIAAKLLDRPDLLDRLRASFDGRPAFIEPWNVTVDEVEVAERLGAPINGTSPDLWHVGFKSAGRKLFSAAGVPVPVGREDVRTVDDVVAAVEHIRERRPACAGVVVKHDNSGAGDGNVVLDIRGDVRAAVEGLPSWYLADLALGGVVEERISGTRFTSPSVQVDIRPDGEPVVLATHEQVLGGDDAQVYTGCRFPAEPAYAAELAEHGRAVGRSLAALGAVGRFALDFAAADDEVFALEVNLRKGGTTHPYVPLRHLVGGRYDAERGCWSAAADGSPRWYRSTDNLVDDAWIGLSPTEVIGAVEGAGLGFDHRTGTGVVLHMLSCLAIDGRFGVTAIGRSDEESAVLYDATAEAVRKTCRGAPGVTGAPRRRQRSGRE
jgi:hypothetical protein